MSLSPGPGYNLRTRKSRQVLSTMEEEDSARRSVLSEPANSRKSRRVSQAGSHSSYIKTKKVENNLDKALQQLDEEEITLELQHQNLQIDILGTQRRIKLHQEALNDKTSWENDEEGPTLKREVRQLEDQLSTLISNQKKIEIDIKIKKKSNEGKRKILLEEADIEKKKIIEKDGRYVVSLPWVDGRPQIPEKEKIVEEDEQVLSSKDETASNHSVNSHPLYELIQKLVDEAAKERIRQQQVAEAEALRLEKQRQELKATLVNQKAKAEQTLQKAKEEVYEANKQKEESERKAVEAAQEQARIEEELKNLRKVETTSTIVATVEAPAGPVATDNKKIAERRLESITKTLVIKNQFENDDKPLKSWEAEHFIEEVPSDQQPTPGHYIPHQAVFKPESLITPIRPVFDASCKAPRTPSLNECMDKGPNQTELIMSILLRFREKRIGVIADIRKAFQMISVAQPDRDYPRFLWWKDGRKKELKIYRHCRVVFGINNSPFLLAAVLEHHLTQKILEFKNWSTKTLADAKMDLRCWECGSEEESGIGALSYSECWLDSGRTEPAEDTKRITSVLGYQWDKMEDTIYCDVKGGQIPVKVTKRTILSYLQRVFDPIGFTCPSTLPLKILLQSLWKDKISWDKELGDEIKEQFLSWCEELEELGRIRIPRHMASGNNSSDRWQLHSFCDGSKKAYSAILFLRTEDPEGKVNLQLLQAKARVAPIKTMTINRLELMGCFIASTLATSVKEALSLQPIPTTYWSDSFTALAWIKGNDEWGTFVGNRVKTICTLTDSDSWRYVPGSLNPADLPSRGCSPRQLSNLNWHLGPDWLKEPPECWPSKETSLNKEEVLAEKKSSKTLICVSGETENPWYVRCSSFSKNIRVMAWILKFIQVSKQQNHKNSDVSKRVKDHKEAELQRRVTRLDNRIKRTKQLIKWYKLELLDRKANHQLLQDKWMKAERLLQEMRVDRSSITRRSRQPVGGEDVFSVGELKAAENTILKLLQRDTLPLNQKIIGGLKVCKLEDDGLLHVRTNLTNRQDYEGFKFPIILPHSHLLVDQLIREEHLKNNHAGVQFLMGQIREKYWIIQRRKSIRKFIGKCVVCRRYSCKKVKVTPAALPEDRVKNSRPFETTGVDLVGPLYSSEKEKTWIVLFTCAVFRCVHLELVTSLSTDAFLDVFACFTSRRGRPTIIYSDNGTNFVGADNLLRKLDWNRITREHGLEKMTWKFNPPAAPWWGGWWERLVRTIKDLLKRTLQNTKINSEKLRTLLCEIEATINNRPLTVVTEDPDDLIPLTPAMFLNDLPCPGVSDKELLHAEGFRKLLKRKTTLTDQIKMRFRREYFALLVHRGKNERMSREFKVGEVVFVGADNKKRREWPMGIILEVMSGKDGKVRVVYVKTPSGILKRPVQHIYPMEIYSASDIPTLAPEIISEEVIQEVIEDPEKPEVITRVGRKVKVPARLGFD